MSDLPFFEGGMAAEIAAEFSTGDMEFLDAVLSRDVAAPTSPAPDPWDPPAVTVAEYACKGIHEDYGLAYRRDGLVDQSDRKVLILAATLAVEPVPGDRITIRGQTFTVVSGAPGQPAVMTDPAKAVWELRCRT